MTTNSVLIVEDERVNVNIILDALKPHFKTYIAMNGIQGLDRARQNLPDIILLDIVMPGMDGYEVCRQLKSDDRTSGIPIIFLTAMSDIGFEKKGLELGAVDYITKPILPDIVRLRVGHHLEKEAYRKSLEIKIQELKQAMAQIKSLKGLLPICAHCKNIRDDKGYWNQIEDYIQKHSEAEFSHGICPNCVEILYPDVLLKK